MTGKQCVLKTVLSDECLVGLYLKDHRGITNKRIIRAFTNRFVLAEQLMEAKQKVNECSVKHHHDCPIEKYLPEE
jgi:hypothetical protein